LYLREGDNCCHCLNTKKLRRWFPEAGSAGWLFGYSAGLQAARKYYRSVMSIKEEGAVSTRQNKVHTQPEVDSRLGRTAALMFAANDRMNQGLIEHLDPAAWTAKPPAKPPGRVRTIAAIFTHMHNVRSKWVRLTAPHLEVPTQLNRAHCTPQEAQAGLAESAARCGEMLAEALSGGGRIEMFRRDALAPTWPAGVEMLCYMLAHEAHHRGQVCMLAHQLGYSLPYSASDGIWNWERLWKDCGAARGPGYES
jgi:uncharacterized damage-inducible protein DinB